MERETDRRRFRNKTNKVSGCLSEVPKYWARASFSSFPILGSTLGLTAQASRNATAEGAAQVQSWDAVDEALEA